MLGAYFSYIYFNYVFAASGTVALLLSIMLAISSVSLVALAIYFGLLRRKINSISYVMVVSLAVALFVEQLIKVVFRCDKHQRAAASAREL